ncbi:pseudouridine synthase family protein isoform X2 [Tasmannia lanceolata]|uniref:pseudouridine synthase family protein isoform X2 n=1 Tax=Tasmannia lanceolata TaxID=3420 RepID=UPI004062F545
MLFSLPTFSTPSAQFLFRTPSFCYFHVFHRENPNYRVLTTLSSSTPPFKSSLPNQNPKPEKTLRTNHAGLRFEETLEPISEKSRLDSWISARIDGVSRARIQSSIRSGLVSVNGRTISKVVHPAPGNANGTLVNGILHHCRLSPVALPNSDIFSETEDGSGDEFESFSGDQNLDEEISSSVCGASVRPGIVHRLDKGTSGLLVVAKDDHSHAHLSEQFKLHTIRRVYVSLTSGIPSPSSGRIEVPIARDSNNRIRMAAVSSASNCRWARHAASRYRVIEVLAGGGSALVEWRLETGRTHQIRAHAKYLGIPLLGDEVYGGTKSMALSLLRPKTPSSYHSHLSHLVSKLERPCLHALSLGFKHPHTGEDVQFSCPPPSDFTEVLSQLRIIGTEKITPLKAM